MNARASDAPASTPTQPSPLQGEGFDGIDRFARTPRIKAGGIARARKLRSDPTYTEAKLWKHLRQFEIRFRRQAPIGPYVVDFACHPARLVVEVDGGVHDLTDVALRDLKRDEWLTSQGYRVIRIPNGRVETDIDAVVAEISKAVAATSPFPSRGKGRGWGGGTPSPASPEDSDPVSAKDRVNARPSGPASTPTQPSPLQGEG